MTAAELRDLEERVRHLQQSELAAFRAWFDEFDANLWDDELEADVADGRLDALAEEALADHRKGQTTDL